MTEQATEDVVSDAFAVLSDETRLDIIRVLGDAGGTGEYRALPFSTLQDSVGVDDSGRFSYHLNKLVGRFIESTDEGYRLRVPGVQVYQAIQAGVYTDHENIDPITTEIPCQVGCGGVCSVRYTDFRFYMECEECGIRRIRYPIDPQSFGDDVPADLLHAADRRLKRDTFSMELGFCPYCAGPIESEYRGQRPNLWDSPEPGNLIASRRTCTRCHWFIDFRTYVIALIKPTVAGEFSAAGVNTFEVPQWCDEYQWTERLISEDPLRVELEMTIQGVTRVVTFDEEMDVISVETPVEVDG